MLLCVVGYAVHDNQRIAVVRQDVMISGLSKAFEGFTIL